MRKEEIWKTIKAPKVNWWQMTLQNPFLKAWNPYIPKCLIVPANTNRINLHVICFFGHQLSWNWSMKISKCKCLYSQVWKFQLAQIWHFPIFCRKVFLSNLLLIFLRSIAASNWKDMEKYENKNSILHFPFYKVSWITNLLLSSIVVNLKQICC